MECYPDYPIGETSIPARDENADAGFPTASALKNTDFVAGEVGAAGQLHSVLGDEPYSSVSIMPHDFRIAMHLVKSVLAR